MTRGRHRLFLAVVLLAAVAGCISRQAGDFGGDSAARPFTPGVTTREDVTRAWGNPARVDGDEWRYEDLQTLGAAARADYYGIGFTLGWTGSQTHSYVVLFDESGKFKSLRTEDTAPGVNHWRIWPFDF